MENFVSAVEIFDTLRSLLKSKDGWKINFRELYETTYTGLWISLLKTGKIKEALLAADQGRAQTLSENLLIQHGIAPPKSATTSLSMTTLSRLLTEISTSIIFLAIDGLTINIWYLSRGNEITFRQGRLKVDITDKDPIRTLLRTALKEIGAEVRVICEDRTIDELTRDCPSTREECEEVKKSFQPSDNPFKPFYDAVIGPICHMLGPRNDELVIVSDGALSLIPWVAVVESIRIRTVPSLTSYQLLSSVPEGHHKKTGALLVGNPCLKELRKPLDDLLYALSLIHI